MFFQKKSIIFVLFICSMQRSLAHTECHLCNSKLFPYNCLDVTQNNWFTRCISEFDQCYTILIKNVVQRGCVSANDLYFPHLNATQQCQNSDECEICKDSKLCNAQKITDTCIKCDSSESNSTCVTVTKAVPCSLRRNFAKSAGCYLSINGSTHIRGCMSDLNLNEQKLCQQQNTNCQSCKYPNCNLKELFKTTCFECDGEVDFSCAHITSRASQVVCYDYTKTCAIGIDKNGFTHRGFISYNQLHSLFPLGFKICNELLCNHGIYPSNRPTCYQCEDNHKCVTLEMLNSTVCDIYPDQCFAYLDNNGTFYRGCMKENSKGRHLCENDAAKCEVCDEDKCNSEKKWEMSASQRLSSFYFSSLLFAFTVLCFLI